MTAPRPWQPGDPVRACGGCTMCCRLTGVLELEKPPNKWCQHCAIGRGCKIYENRPASCRAFQCLWLTSPAMGEELRPDRCKVVWEMTEDGLVALALTNYPGALQSIRIRRLIAYLNHHGATVIGCIPGSSEPFAVYLAPGMSEDDAKASLMATAENQARRFAEVGE